MYSADLSSPGGDAAKDARQRSDEQHHLFQFVLQASLDVVQEAVWSSQNMFLKVRGRGGWSRSGRARRGPAHAADVVPSRRIALGRAPSGADLGTWTRCMFPQPVELPLRAPQFRPKQLEAI